MNIIITIAKVVKKTIPSQSSKEQLRILNS